MIKIMTMIAVVATTIWVSCTGNPKEEQRDDAVVEGKQLSRASNGDMLLLVGTYTSGEGSKGVYLYRFDTDTGKSDSLSMVEVDNPSYLALSPDERFVYAVSERDGANSAVHAFSLDKSKGRMELLNSRPVNSAGPCYITIPDFDNASP